MVPRFTDAGSGIDAHSDVVLPRDTRFVINEDAVCARQSSLTQMQPPNLLIVLDRSISMADDGKWTAAVAAVTSLVNSLGDESRVGLTLFPSHVSANSASGYSTPLVPVGPLSTTRALIVGAMANDVPMGGTPMACAFQGTKTYFDTAMSDGVASIVLITDGEPTNECCGVECSMFPPDIACLLQADEASKLRTEEAVSALASRILPVSTFVCGTPAANEVFLSTLAVKGLTSRSMYCSLNNTCHYTLSTASFASDLGVALRDIHRRMTTCEFQIAVDRTHVDLGNVTVVYFPVPGAWPELVPRDSLHTNGWDFSADGTAILLFGTLCDAVRNQWGEGEIKILYGCP